MRRRWLCLVVVAAGGCAGGLGPDAGVPDAGSADAGLPDAGLPLDDALQLDATRGLGGFELPCTADGGAVYQSTYRVPLDGGSMHFEVCRQGGLGFHRGDRVPTGLELRALRVALAGLAPTTRTACGADKAYLRLDVTTPKQVLVLADGFYACEGLTDRTYVDNLDPLFAELERLTEP